MGIPKRTKCWRGKQSRLFVANLGKVRHKLFAIDGSVRHGQSLGKGYTVEDVARAGWLYGQLGKQFPFGDDWVPGKSCRASGGRSFPVLQLV